MTKSSRCIALILVLALLCGMIQTACADVVTLGIYFCGRRTTEDGSQQTVRLEGRFRVTQNGEEVGIITAGDNTLTLNSTERIRIEPLPDSIAPEWELSTAVKGRRVHPDARTDAGTDACSHIHARSRDPDGRGYAGRSRGTG